MMLSGHGGGGGGGRRLFTASQWQELEHQALIYKYMASGSPVPHDLVLPLRLATGVDTAPSLAFPPQTTPSLGYWGCYGAGAQFGRKAEDPEPGRCRRTDGKKWRCSREAHGDSKYCEKHIHRGKSRSRKPVEAVTSSATSPAAGAGAYRPSALSISPPRAPDAVPSFGHHHHQQQQQQHLHHGASSARAPAQTTATGPLQLHLDASLHAASPPPSYHRYAHAYAHYAPQPSLFPGGGYGHGQSKELLQDAELRHRHYLALGADLSLDKPHAAAAAGHVQDAASTEKPLRRFFDEWPREGGDARPWTTMGAEDATQLSISIPAASPSDLAAAAARYHNGELLHEQIKRPGVF
ncbi:Growth-regulating factor 2 [Dichanthelium oligosanthes]|uniref:Growth-regulating factor n=1 Tax=Dichanthelium oligosanthes TaxID=888268 RepID=A0A1E5WIJ3_9POAL|nr:Growth-regulating factor 2 [Dichanthelium oligosanthes]